MIKRKIAVGYRKVSWTKDGYDTWVQDYDTYRAMKANAAKSDKPHLMKEYKWKIITLNIPVHFGSPVQGDIEDASTEKDRPADRQEDVASTINH